MSEDKNIVNTKSEKTTFKIILFLSIIIASIGIFLASYYSSIYKVYDSYETTLVTDINGINEVNKNIAQFNSLQTIDIKYAKDQLPNIIKNLSTLRYDLSNSQPTSKYRVDHENLKSGLDNNILIYRQALAILNNPSGPDVAELSANLKTYRNDCMNFYSLLNIKNIRIDLPPTTLSFIDNVLNYSYKSLMMKKEDDIKSQQNKEFISKIDDLSKNFLDIKINYSSYVLKVRKKSMSYDELLLLVDNNFAKLSMLQTDFKNLSIPASTLPTYQAFRPLLYMYENYLRDFKLALISEKIQTLSAVVSPSVLDALYDSSNVKFGELQNSYNGFVKVFTQLKK
ncbi:hypothetical protein K9O30_04120 [Clostridium bowmanii]|uniref:hypothetical protein n=1 Tax=Clostridium bowmanii TaxID=132925 RepID=UPI001C0C8C90|nr:hypothetical protein [Clostridium bowmanii]MBU3188545.1 hypothetical protein [Clostridium bowmanii]MCA1072929.1 hypothetical protein [Clostridium bowmanii]